MQGRAIPRAAALICLLGLVLAGCGEQPIAGEPGSAGEEPGSATEEPGSPTEDPGQPEGTSEPAANQDDGEAAYGCFSEAYPESAWEEQRPLESVDHPALDVLHAELAADTVEGWFVLEASDERLTVARERIEPMDDLDPLRRTHDLLSIQHVENVEGGPWVLGQWSSCTPQLALDGLGPADVWLDGDPDREASVVDLLVHEHACASGQYATDRVRVVELEESDEAVTVVVGVEPLGEADCPDNPATPLSIELSAPLGDRELSDGSVYPPQPIPLAPDDIYR